MSAKILKMESHITRRYYISDLWYIDVTENRQKSSERIQNYSFYLGYVGQPLQQLITDINCMSFEEAEDFLNDELLNEKSIAHEELLYAIEYYYFLIPTENWKYMSTFPAEQPKNAKIVSFEKKSRLNQLIK